MCVASMGMERLLGHESVTIRALRRGKGGQRDNTSWDSAAAKYDCYQVLLRYSYAIAPGVEDQKGDRRHE